MAETFPTITVVTGSEGKRAEIAAILPETFAITNTPLDIPEIQGEPRYIALDKLEKAYALLKRPVLVEDTSAELTCLGGMPGPYIKFFEKALGDDALWKLVQGHDDHSATIRSTVGYYDGAHKIIVDAEVHGTIVEPRGTNGFGFDKVFMPDSHTQTVAEMSPEEKNEISWRGLAVRKLGTELLQILS